MEESEGPYLLQKFAGPCNFKRKLIFMPGGVQSIDHDRSGFVD